MKKRKLILLTSEFPYGNGETFLETEIEFLASAFDEVVIFSSARSTEKKRSLPGNVQSRLFSTQISAVDKLKALLGVFSKEYKLEKKRVREVYKLNWTSGIRNTALISLYTARRWKEQLSLLTADSEGVDLTFYSYWCTDTAIGLSLLQRLNLGIKTFSRAHGWDLYFEATNFQYQPFRALISEGLTGLFPISEMGAEYIRKNWKVEPNRIQVARLGTKEMNQPKRDENRNVLVSCSNLVPLKRVHLIAEALKYVSDVEISWYHFGDGSERAAVEHAVKEIDSENIAVHLKGRKENAEILKWFEEVGPDLFVNVSTTEGIPVSIMEAMSFGTPVFATNVGGTSEIVNSDNGQLLDAKISAQELGQKIEEFFLMSSENQRKIGEMAFKTWKASYSASKNYAKFTQELLD